MIQSPSSFYLKLCLTSPTLAIVHGLYHIQCECITCVCETRCSWGCSSWQRDVPLQALAEPTNVWECCSMFRCTFEKNRWECPNTQTQCPRIHRYLPNPRLNPSLIKSLKTSCSICISDDRASEPTDSIWIPTNQLSVQCSQPNDTKHAYVHPSQNAYFQPRRC